MYVCMDAYIYNIFNIIYISKIYELEPKLKNNCFKNFKDFIWERTMICDIFVKKQKLLKLYAIILDRIILFTDSR